jgi:hypothetical protein
VTLYAAWGTAVASAGSVFLKVDTQGYDLKVLRGAKEHLREVKLLQVEAGLQPTYEGSPMLAEVLEVVADNGFAISGIYPTTRNGLCLGEVDVVAINN